MRPLTRDEIGDHRLCPLFSRREVRAHRAGDREAERVVVAATARFQRSRCFWAPLSRAEAMTPGESREHCGPD